ncbi:MAG TPA: hypothetical protein VLA54_07245 [Acidimicrobiia bacterium]|nr:hypothetical protein [Acidimicrobiia bacterium]
MPHGSAEQTYGILGAAQASSSGDGMVGVEIDRDARARPFGLLWTAVGVVVMSLAAVAGFRLDDGITRMVVGAALATCLAMAAMVWLRRCDSNSIERPDRRD